MKTLQSAKKPYLGSKISRVAGRVIENPFVSVTIDVLMMRIIVEGPAVATEKNSSDGEVGNNSLLPNLNVSPIG